ncbi:7821_t:CDS:2, partial [Entrophospora sp. SA101]
DNPQSPTSENQIETARESSSPSILSTTSLYSLYVPSSPNSSNDEEFIKSGKKTFQLLYFTGPGILE